MPDFDADVVVVGSGALGAQVAYEIAHAGKSVIILEAGPNTPDWRLTENFRVSPRKDNLSDPFGSLDYAPNSWTPGYVSADIDADTIPGTIRSVGGTARHWTGVAWRLLPEEMKMRSTFGVGRDWPFGYDVLEPFYTAADYQIGVAGLTENDDSGRNLGHTYPPRSKPYPLPPEAKPYFIQRFQMRTAARGYITQQMPGARVTEPYDGRPACIGNNICNPNCPIGAKYSGQKAVERAVKAGAQLRHDAIVDTIAVDGRGRITSISYQSPTGVRSTLTARRYVIAGHGFETPKLLMMNGLAGRTGLLGRNMMIHPSLNMSFFADEPVWTGRGQAVHGAMVQRRLMKDRGETAGGFYQFVNSSPVADVAADILKEGRLVGAAFDEELRRRASQVINIQILLEDLPVPDNGIALNPGWKDRLGLPGLRLRYRIPDYAKAALPRTIADYANWVQAMGGTPRQVPGQWTVQHHIMGTTIMGDDPDTSIVDADLRSHDHDNLFLVTTGVFPSASCVNPTLTGIALAIRAGRHIAGEV
ncbi:GMC family oxidoreductase [Sphingomonas abietis]|uniref:GMC family oxidoreductase n=1 Tax=Sphingomonas abietis TaxID=3012344 RepID=A0ABY7NPB6_9SPHN|nr:GMC family oxidoreductase [Sphingomonas abietis]WBO21321.1 GMC family oxidoreductase [Sphingomonas abietis]